MKLFPNSRTLLAAVFLALPPMLHGQGSELVLSPERPTAGQPVEVVYRPAPELAGETSLRVRARLRKAGSGDDDNTELGSREVAVLSRAPDGSFRGTLRLPESTVLAVLAVEDVEATRVDTRQGRFWDVPVHDPSGRPLFEALAVWVSDSQARDRLLLLDVVRSMTRHHPDRLDSWVARSQVEPFALGAAAAPAVVEEHRARFRTTDAEHRPKANLTADQLESLYAYALGLGEEDAFKYWLARLSREHPASPTAVFERTREIRRAHEKDPRERLVQLQALWNEAVEASARKWVAPSALEAALAAGDADAAVAWADRLLALNPAFSTSVARSLAGNASTRPLGIGRMREELRVVDAAPDDRRVLGATRLEHRSSMAEHAASLRADLARAVIADGNAAEGLALLESAASVGWSTARFRRLGEARLASGDTDGARTAFAKAAADPALSAAAADSLRSASGAAPERWAAAVEEERREMVRFTLASARTGGVPDGRLVEGGGRPTRLRDLLGKEATVVHFWTTCPASLGVLPAVLAIEERLRSAGVPVLVVSGERRADSEEFLRSSGMQVSALYDEHNEVTRALGNYRAQSFVLDGAGRVRFTFSRLEDVERQVAALRGEAALRTGGGSR